MDEQPSLIERWPQLFSLGIGICAVAAAIVEESSGVLSAFFILLALCCLALRLWIPHRRRRRYGY